MPTKRTKTAHTASRGNRRRPIARKVARARSTPPVADHTTSKPMLIGYARVSTIDQNLALQRDALAEAGCGRISLSNCKRRGIPQGLTPLTTTGEHLHAPVCAGV